jgi:hypothetical protein
MRKNILLKSGGINLSSGDGGFDRLTNLLIAE